MYSYAEDEHLMAKMTLTPDIVDDDGYHHATPPQISLQIPPQIPPPKTK
jgi:hypothetical protein